MSKLDVNEIGRRRMTTKSIEPKQKTYAVIMLKDMSILRPSKKISDIGRALHDANRRVNAFKK